VDSPIAEARPNPLGTAAILVSCLVSFTFAQQETYEPSLMARQVAFALAGGIGASFLLDWQQGGLRNLIRVDVAAFLSFFFLTFFEFIFPQSHFDNLVIPIDVKEATEVLLIGYAAMAIGRHIPVGPQIPLRAIGEIRMQPNHYLMVFFGSFVLSFLPQWLAVGFNPFVWLEELMQPRFTQSWGRGKFGNLSTLLFELQLLGYVIAPLAGVILSEHRKYPKTALAMVILSLLLSWFVAFCGGTRNIFGIQLAGFLGGYFIVQKKLNLIRMATAALVFGALFVVLAEVMLEFRNMGLSRYIENFAHREQVRELESLQPEPETETGYFVDYNLWRLSQMMPAFPELYDYLGWNVMFVAITKPIPRAFWPGKPVDLEVGLEEVVGARGYTVAVTWVGEAFIAGGGGAVFATGIAIGMFCAYWNRLTAFTSTAYPLLVFASGFYAVLLLMRSLMFFTTALLPSCALIAAGLVFFRKRA
jgi:hypothetical protein